MRAICDHARTRRTSPAALFARTFPNLSRRDLARDTSATIHKVCIDPRAVRQMCLQLSEFERAFNAPVPSDIEVGVELLILCG